jgi:hypothetical protein
MAHDAGREELMDSAQKAVDAIGSAWAGHILRNVIKDK